MKLKIFAFLFLLPFLLNAQGRADHSLNGEWTFALDPVKIGENNKWFHPEFPSNGFDKVTVPHSFSVDPRYMFYTGRAWYFKHFNVSKAADQQLFLQFDAVFYRARIWLNGVQVGSHEGGYTPFEVEVTRHLKNENILAVEVDNSWDTTTIPGAKTTVQFENPNAAQLFPWINYGGITRSVHLLARPAVYIENLKIAAVPDLQKGTAKISFSAFLKNSSTSTSKLPVTANIFFQGEKINATFKPGAEEVRAGEKRKIELSSVISANQMKLWNQDEPNLYMVKVSCGPDTMIENFGIRKVEIRGTSLLLNGLPIKMGGCNRPLDYPGFGSMDPQHVLQQDMMLAKNGSMELSRISHYPVSEALLDWADEHGMLIITEAGNWQMTPRQMSDTLMREKFRSQFREMIQRDWNHPSIIAYSVGNEFQSHTEEGKAWVRDMGGYARLLDSSRLITFASMFVFRDVIKKPEDEASQYVDFISANIYGNHLKNLQHIHELYPNKPVYISEFVPVTFPNLDGYRRKFFLPCFIHSALFPAG